VLSWLTALEADASSAHSQYNSAKNMTDKLPALGLLISKGKGETALQAFYTEWKHEPLVLDKWFGVQATRTAPEDAVETVRALTTHPDFNWKNPNRFRALMGSFAMGNIAGFHAPSGAGYELVADWLIKLDPVNPQITARMATAFESWRQYSDTRQAQMRAALERVLAVETLSKNTREIASRILG
jgi:aminopeptidase N